MDFVVLLNGGQGLGKEGDWVPFFIFRGYLGQDSASRKVGTIGFNAEGSGQVGRDENWSGSDALLQSIEGRSFSAFSMPSGIIPSQVEERVGMF